MHDLELRWVEESTGIEPIDRNVISNPVGSVSEIESGIRSAKRPVRGGDAAVWLLGSQTRARSYLYDHAGLVAKLCRRSTRNYFKRLNRIERNLVGEHLALLIGDRLAIERERVLSVIAESMEETIRIRADSRRRERYQRTHRRRRALQRKLVEHAPIDVGVEGGNIFDQVCPVALDCHRLHGGSDLQANFQIDWNRRSKIEILNVGRKSAAGDRHVVRVERDIRDAEGSRVVGAYAPFKLTDRIANLDGRTKYNRARRINNSTAD